jgi:hypothetical protein
MDFAETRPAIREMDIAFAEYKFSDATRRFTAFSGASIATGMSRRARR